MAKKERAIHIPQNVSLRLESLKLFSCNLTLSICTSPNAYKVNYLCGDEIAMGKLAIILYFILSVFPADEAMILDIIDKNWSKENNYQEVQ